MTSLLDTIAEVTQVTCLSSLAGQAPALLSAGIHSFPFKLGLPLGLPSTFLGKHGWVQFFCKAAIKENGGLVHKNQQVFIVMNPIDLNVEPPVLAVSVGAPVEDGRWWYVSLFHGKCALLWFAMWTEVALAWDGFCIKDTRGIFSSNERQLPVY